MTVVKVNCLVCGTTTRQFQQQQAVGALLYHGSRLVPLLFGLLWPEDDLSVLLPLGAKLCFCSLWSCMEYSVQPRNKSPSETQQSVLNKYPDYVANFRFTLGFVSAEGSLIYILSMWKKLFFLEIQVEYHIKVILISTSGGLS